MSQTSAVKVDDKYQTVLPETICKQLNVREGDELLVDVQDGLLIMLPRPSSFVDRLRGLHREIWAGMIPILIYGKSEKRGIAQRATSPSRDHCPRYARIHLSR